MSDTSGHGRELEGGVGGLAAGDEVIREDACGDGWQGKLSERMAQFATGIAELEAAGEDHGQGGARDEAQLAQT